MCGFGCKPVTPIPKSGFYIRRVGGKGSSKDVSLYAQEEALRSCFPAALQEVIHAAVNRKYEELVGGGSVGLVVLVVFLVLVSLVC